ncbi:PREDICTED: ran-binding protein 9-like [Priapulus caudatus]|uniref:Ran-binding protein 9-like n=1 Tax=Priapulus caudatus TaxID=37621 RepID=A0ABM1EM98_PRICU|nr:PREDICTED: ran-binding protein 9-like [Priapulus caudatus]
MAMSPSGDSGSTNTSTFLNTQPQLDRLKLLYPAVNEEETPLPRSWSVKDKFNFIGLSQNNLRVHYKGVGKNHKDAASVRAWHPIPAACGLYYFEVKIVSKGRDGYMGIGLSAQGINLNRLPGWDKHSYGYHGDDGHSFCSSGTGQPYGPTFTTGDVIGCGVNLIDHTCFYTKNGVNLGVAFSDLPPNLYPTVGLQTPGEVVDTNFGQNPFVYDIEDEIKEIQSRIRGSIENFPVCDKKGEWQTALHRIMSTYLVHHGYCATAEAFARSTGQAFEEELTSIKNRQRIQKLVLAGRMGEAIDMTQQLYPGLLERNLNLLFMLKCRQFIEMVNGTDSEVRGSAIRSPKSRNSSGGSSSRSSPGMSPNYHSVQKSGSSSPSHIINTKPPPQAAPQQQQNSDVRPLLSEEAMNDVNVAAGSAVNGGAVLPPAVGMETESGRLLTDELDRGSMSNGTSSTTNGAVSNGTCHQDVDGDCDMEIDHDQPEPRRQLCGGSAIAVDRMLQFGKELQQLSVQLRQEFGKNDVNKKILRNAYSLLAYADPWSSPVGYQLAAVEREPVCAALNSAILESHNLPRQPPLELVIGQAKECMNLMSRAGMGSCAFVSVDSYLH